MTETVPKPGTLDDFYPVEYPRNRCVLELVDNNKELELLTIGFPSWHDFGKVNLCHYFIQDSNRDFCLCEGAEKYHKRCWHLAWRPIILKAFLNRKLEDDTTWLTNIEIYGAHSVSKIGEYIISLLDWQPEVSQVDLLDLELRDYEGEPVDRRRIGVAFQLLHKFGEIEAVRQITAQYSKRKGGKVYVWRKKRSQTTSGSMPKA